MRYACTGWALAGQSTQSGWGTSCRFYLTGDLTLTWNWTLQYQFQAAATPIWGGGVYPPSGWVNVNQTVNLKASPALNFRFANWSGDATGTSTTLTLKMDRAKTVTARFERLASATGTVSITVWPPAAGWSLADSDRITHQGNGPARLGGVAAGPVTVNWLPPAGYAAPVPLQVTKTLAAQGEVAFTEVFVPKAAGMSRTAALILRYLLGLSTDPTGLDVNGDGKVNIADLQWANERALPNPMILPNPADGATNVSVNAALSWAAVPHASRYNLYLWKASQARPATPTVSGIAANSFRPASPLAFMTDYRWMVVSMNANGMTTGSVWRFTTDRNR